jgi:hypothetical protein
MAKVIITPHELAVGRSALYTLAWQPPALGRLLVVPGNPGPQKPVLAFLEGQTVYGLAEHPSDH